MSIVKDSQKAHNFQKEDMLEKIKSFIYNLTLKERSPEKLARSCSLAFYLSFSPWIGMQYPLVFSLSWLFSLNTAVVFTIASIISNPFTYVPLCMVDYMTGYWFLHKLLGFPVEGLNPVWMTHFNDYIQQALGIPNVSVWAFVVGGNVVGIVLALIAYPLCRYLFSYLGKHA